MLGAFTLFIPLQLDAQLLTLQNYTMEDGLPANHVTAICQDSRGYMWIGTSDGLSIFDGVTFRPVIAQREFPDTYISAIVEDRLEPGTMWILCRRTLVRLRADSVQTFDQAGAGITSIHQDRSGVVWCVTGSGVLRVEGRSITKWDGDSGVDPVSGIGETADSVLWFVKHQSVVRRSLDDGGMREFRLPINGARQVWDVVGDREGSLWVAAERLYRISDTGVADSWENRFGSWLTTDRQGNLWFAGYGGLGTLSGNRAFRAEPVLYTASNGVTDLMIRTIYADREDNVWIGGRDKGLSLLRHGAVMKFPTGPVWGLYQHRFAVSDRRGHIWLISDNKLREFWRDRHGRWGSYTHTLRIGRRPAIDVEMGFVFADDRGDLWINGSSTDRLALRFAVTPGNDSGGSPGAEHSTLRFRQAIPLPAPKTQSYAIGLIVDRRGTIWASMGRKGIYRIDPDDPSSAPAFFGDPAGVPSNYIRELFEDRDGNIWASSFEGGVVRISPDGRVRKFTMSDGLPDNACWPIAQDPGGSILVGMTRAGLAEISGDSVRVFSAGGSMPSNNVTSMAFDSLGRLWVGTSIGLLRETGPGTRVFVNHPELQGAGAAAIGVLGDGVVWYHIENNLTVYDSRAERMPPGDVRVYVTNARLNGADVPLRDRYELSHDQSTIEIRYIGLVFGDPAGPSFRYRLLGADDAWQGPTKNRSITFGHLDPGSYAFEVAAAGRDGSASGTPATVSIVVAPPYWLRWWFIATCFCLLAGSAAAAARLRTARYRREELVAEEFSRKLIESQERERKRLAGELHDELGQELLVMINRAQMGLQADSLEKARRQLEEVSDAGARAIEGVRAMAFNLRPYHLEQLGLTESLKSMIGNVAGSVPMTFTVSVDPVDGLVAPADEINVFRIVQECLNNIVKHSAAAHAEIGIRPGNGRIHIRIRDDGRGIGEPAPASLKGGLGLPGIAERVKLLGGSLEVTSRAGRGTLVEVSIPCAAMGPAGRKAV